MRAMDNNSIDHSNTYLTILTIMLTAFSKLNFTFSDAAAICAIVAGLTTAMVNIAKYKEIRRNAKK
jgi:hypothetical protein